MQDGVSEDIRKLCQTARRGTITLPACRAASSDRVRGGLKETFQTYVIVYVLPLVLLKAVLVWNCVETFSESQNAGIFTKCPARPVLIEEIRLLTNTFVNVITV